MKRKPLKLLPIFFIFLTQLSSFVSAEGVTLKLPVLIPLTGSAAEQGEWIRKGVFLAQERFNQDATLKVEAIFEDTQADPKNAISAYMGLKSKNKFSAVLTYGSGVGVALSPITNADKIIQMGLATSSPAYRSANDYTFRNFPSADVESKFTVDAMVKALNVKEMGLVNIQNEYGVSTKNSIKNLFQGQGGVITAEEEIEPNGTDYRSLILKLKSKKLKFIYLAVYPLEGATFIKQAREMGITSTFIAGPAIIGSEKFMDLAKDAAEGLIVSTNYPLFLRENNSNTRKFVNGYLKNFNEQVSLQHIYAARAYDAFLVLAEGMKSCVNDSECLKNYLYNLKQYDGVSGSFTFDENGDVSSKFELDIIKGKTFLPLSK